jgi:hypothetical protein
MLAWLREAAFSDACSVPPPVSLLLDLDQSGHARTAQGSTTSTVAAPQPAPCTAALPYPPAGILPPHGTSLLLGPLCFLYRHPAAIYRMHAALYQRYWCKLACLDAAALPAPALPCLTRTYETLLQVLHRRIQWLGPAGLV